MGHQLKDAGCHPTPKLKRCQDRCEAEFILTLDICSYGTLFAVYSPELSKDECVEEGTHVQHGGLKRKQMGAVTFQGAVCSTELLPACVQPSRKCSPSTSNSWGPRLKEFSELKSHDLSP